jgi:hypothetical protein
MRSSRVEHEPSTLEESQQWRGAAFQVSRAAREALGELKRLPRVDVCAGADSRWDEPAAALAYQTDEALDGEGTQKLREIVAGMKVRGAGVGSLLEGGAGG